MFFRSSWRDKPDSIVTFRKVTSKLFGEKLCFSTPFESTPYVYYMQNSENLTKNGAVE